MNHGGKQFNKKKKNIDWDKYQSKSMQLDNLQNVRDMGVLENMVKKVAETCDVY